MATNTLLSFAEVPSGVFLVFLSLSVEAALPIVFTITAAFRHCTGATRP
jgi:hypothetical protein